MSVDPGEHATRREGTPQSLVEEVAQLMGVTASNLVSWEINYIRPDGAVDAHVPRDEMDVEGVPTDPRNITRLIKLFEERAEEVGGTGQRDAVVLGQVPDDAIYMLDGFHRHETQGIRGVATLHATVELGLTYEQVVQRRLEYARTHTEVEFARQVEWMQSVWERSPWFEKVPNVLTAFRAFQEDYGHQGTDDVEIIDGLSDEEYKQICEWVAAKSKEWGYTTDEIRENLTKVEHFDDELLGLIYQGRGRTPAGRISLRHAELITGVYGGEFHLQKAIVKLVVDNELSVKQTEALLVLIENDNPMEAEDVLETAKGINFLKLKARNKTSGPTKGMNRAGARSGLEGLNSMSVAEALHSIRERLPEIKEGASDWDAETADDALEIAMVLSEALAELAITAEAKKAKNKS